MGPAKQVILGVNPVGADAYHQVYQVCMLCQQVKVCTAILHSAHSSTPTISAFIPTHDAEGPNQGPWWIQ